MQQNNMKPKLLFTEKALPLILEAFGNSIDKDGYIIDSRTNEPVTTPDGDLVEAKKFGGIKKGSKIFIKDDLYSIMNLAEGNI